MCHHARIPACEKLVPSRSVAQLVTQGIDLLLQGSLPVLADLAGGCELCEKRGATAAV